MKKRQQQSKFWAGATFPIAVAHRGGDGAGIEKENSIAAFQAAYDLGYRWFETDLVPTRDGMLLALHGRGFQRHPNRDLPSRLRIQRMSYAEVMQSIKIGGEKILTLEELLDAFPDVKFFIDPKTLKAAPALAKSLIKRPQDIDRVWIGSFIPFNNAIVYRIVKQATAQKVGLALLGPLKSIPIKLAAIMPILKPVASAYIRWTRAESIHIPYGWIAGKSGMKIIELCRELGLKTGVYTPNSNQDIKGSLDKGVDVIMSDNIRILKTLIKS